MGGGGGSDERGQQKGVREAKGLSTTIKAGTGSKPKSHDLFLHLFP